MDQDMSQYAMVLGWFATSEWTDYLGVLGVIGYVCAYFMLQVGILKSDGYGFSILNLIASGCILISLSRDFNAYSTSVELAWSTISIIGLTRVFIFQKLVRLESNEARAVAILAPRLKAHRARRLLRIGEMKSVPADALLAKEGEVLDQLSVILDGMVEVSKSGVEVAFVGPGGVIGEMTYETAAAATATVKVATEVKIFAIDTSKLRSFLANNPDIATEMSISSGVATRNKLVETTSSLAFVKSQSKR